MNISTYGLESNPARATRIAPVVEALFADLTELDCGESDARETGRVRAELERAGTQIGLCDSMIAGTARDMSLTLVTHNTRELERVQALAVVDWHSP